MGQSRRPSRWSCLPTTHGLPQARRTAAAPTSPARHTDLVGAPPALRTRVPLGVPDGAAGPPASACGVRWRQRCTAAGSAPSAEPDVGPVDQGGGRGAKLGGHLSERPSLGGQPVHQIRPHLVRAQLGGALLGGVLLGGALALAAGELLELVVGDGAANGRFGDVEVGGEPGDAPAVVQQRLQAAAEVREAQASGLLVEVAVATSSTVKLPLMVRAATQTCWWGYFPCARSAGRPSTPEDPR